MANFMVTRGLGGLVENAKVNVGNLYLRQIFARWDNNQSDVIEPNAETALGKTAVNNWGIYDGAGSEAKLVANGQGMQALAGNWNSFTLVFTVERFKDSTLQVMGANVAEENEWAIVGGTGEFAMARGIIKRRVYSVTGGTLTQELNIEFFCRMKVPAPIKRGPWGGNGGTLREMEGKSQRLESVTINHGGVVHAIGFSYIDENGQIRTAGIWGLILNAAPDKTETIKFGPSEVVKQIVGSRRPATAVGSSLVFITKFQIVTNQQTYGPFGTDDGSTSFSYTVPDDETVVGFFANTSDRVYKIGLYTI